MSMNPRRRNESQIAGLCAENLAATAHVAQASAFAGTAHIVEATR
jgi:hypothetical protein